MNPRYAAELRMNRRCFAFISAGILTKLVTDFPDIARSTDWVKWATFLCGLGAELATLYLAFQDRSAAQNDMAKGLTV